MVSGPSILLLRTFTECIEIPQVLEQAGHPTSSARIGSLDLNVVGAMTFGRLNKCCGFHSVIDSELATVLDLEHTWKC